MFKLEDSLAPLEFASFAGKVGFLSSAARTAFQQLDVWQVLVHEQPTRYLRTEIAPNVTFYSDPNFATAGKALVLAFGAGGGGLSMGTTAFLQFVPSEKFDVVLLRDPLSNQFLNGLPNYADDFPQLAARLVANFHPQRYARVVCFGTSMGGFAALRCGLLLGGVRSISVAGRFTWIGRLLDGTERSIPAFEILCACKHSWATDFVCVYGEQALPDRQAVDRLATMFPIARRPIEGVSSHNVLYEIWKRGNVGNSFYAELLSF